MRKKKFLACGANFRQQRHRLYNLCFSFCDVTSLSIQRGYAKIGVSLKPASLVIFSQNLRISRTSTVPRLI
ncbi:hypothetical protein Mapa_010846 [Marchantia paleacea]|nr:hypothetical protein Mapa_010846 [Marchantia paleacea]